MLNGPIGKFGGGLAVGSLPVNVVLALPSGLVPLAVQVETLVVLQVSAEEPPTATDEGVAVMVTVGVTLVDTFSVAVPAPVRPCGPVQVRI